MMVLFAPGCLACSIDIFTYLHLIFLTSHLETVSVILCEDNEMELFIEQLIVGEKYSRTACRNEISHV